MAFHQLPARSPHRPESHLKVKSLPTTCPICNFSIEPIIHATGHVATAGEAQFVFRCPRAACSSLFLATYEEGHDDAPIGVYGLRRLEPRYPAPPSFPEHVAALSSSFVEIFTQATQAEAWRLHQIAGVGFRKALEFLIKDFAIHRRPGEKQQIEKQLLATCINNYIEDPNVKKNAARATWLGNDETHYLRKWADRDIADLRILIRLTVNAIENVLLQEHYEKEMPAGK